MIISRNPTFQSFDLFDDNVVLESRTAPIQPPVPAPAPTVSVAVAALQPAAVVVPEPRSVPEPPAAKRRRVTFSNMHERT